MQAVHIESAGVVWPLPLRYVGAGGPGLLLHTMLYSTHLGGGGGGRSRCCEGRCNLLCSSECPLISSPSSPPPHLLSLISSPSSPLPHLLSLISSPSSPPPHLLPLISSPSSPPPHLLPLISSPSSPPPHPCRHLVCLACVRSMPLWTTFAPSSLRLSLTFSSVL